MRIVYIGNVDFSYHCLQEVIYSKGNVVGVVSSKRSSGNSDYRDLSTLAATHGIPIYHYKKNINERESIEWIKTCRPDIIFCWGISQIVKEEMLSVASKGVIGVHATHLPKNRGRHPLIWALALGLKESALTFFKIDTGVDSGPILSQKIFNIKEDDDATTLYEKVKKLASKQIKEFLPKLINNQETYLEQKVDKANYWRKRKISDGVIDWRMSKEAIYNLVRALTKPYVGAAIKYKESDVKIWKVEIYKKHVDNNIEPGKVIEVSGDIPVVKCYDGAISLLNYEPKMIFKEGEYLQ